MAMFGISHTVNTRVGNDFVRGVSGGERKRVSIAEAALSFAPLQCWDNSTRGSFLSSLNQGNLETDIMQDWILRMPSNSARLCEFSVMSLAHPHVLPFTRPHRPHTKSVVPARVVLADYLDRLESAFICKVWG